MHSIIIICKHLVFVWNHFLVQSFAALPILHNNLICCEQQTVIMKVYVIFLSLLTGVMSCKANLVLQITLHCIVELLVCVNCMHKFPTHFGHSINTIPSLSFTAVSSYEPCKRTWVNATDLSLCSHSTLLYCCFFNGLSPSAIQNP